MNAITSARAANDRAYALAAHELFEASGIDWPVSADETVKGYGYIGYRRLTGPVNVWTSPGVTPKIKTTGIRVGDTIRTCWGEEIVVTRVGTVAGWGLLSGTGEEIRWEQWTVSEICPA